MFPLMGTRRLASRERENPEKGLWGCMTGIF